MGYTASFGVGLYDLWVLKLDNHGEIPCCDIIGDSDAVVLDTSATVEDTTVSPQDNSSATVADAYVIPQDTSAQVSQICPVSCIQAGIDVKPGSYPNSINLGSRGVIPVAILSSNYFDATQVDPSTVELSGAGVAIKGKGNILAHQEDVNGDGLIDLVVQVETENLNPAELQTGKACLIGKTYAGDSIAGSDEIVIVPPETAPAKPTEFALSQNYSNPFNPDTWIPYQLAEDVDVTIRIYNASGQLVRTLDLGHKTAGFYTTKGKAAYWDGRNERGEEVTSGVYFIVMRAGEFTATRKMLMLK